MRYIAKPIVINAIQYFNTGESFEEVDDFVNGELFTEDSNSVLDTIYGKVSLNDGDYIIKDEAGKFTVLYKELFEQTYSIKVDMCENCHDKEKCSDECWLKCPYGVDED